MTIMIIMTIMTITDFGTDVGTVVGTVVDTDVGADAGTDVGTDVGIVVGTIVGTDVGTDVGTVVGTDVGTDVSTDVGTGGAAEESRRKNLMSHQQKTKMTPNRNHFAIFLTQTCRYFNEGSFLCRRGPNILLCLARGGRGGGVTAQELDVASAKKQNDP